MTPRQISLLSGTSHTDEVCGPAGNVTVVRSMDAPYRYTSPQHRRELMKHADECAPHPLYRSWPFHSRSLPYLDSVFPLSLRAIDVYR